MFWKGIKNIVELEQGWENTSIERLTRQTFIFMYRTVTE